MNTIKRIFQFGLLPRELVLGRRIVAATLLPIMVFYMTSLNFLVAGMMAIKAAEVTVAAEAEIATATVTAPVPAVEEVIKEEPKIETPVAPTPAVEIPKTEAPAISPIESQQALAQNESTPILTNENQTVPVMENIEELVALPITPAAEVSATMPAEKLVWVADGKKSTTNIPVALNTTYVAPQNDQVTITFTKLPDNPGKLSIEEITLSKEQVTSLHALSNKAYDIMSDMTDGSFEYKLTLPKPKDQKNVDIKFAEDIVGLQQANIVPIEDVTAKTNSVNATLDHFTVFVVTNSTFISKWDTTKISSGSSGSNQIKLPLYPSGKYNFTVDWGDGVIDEITAVPVYNEFGALTHSLAYDESKIAHTYVEVGVKTIKINGVIEGFQFKNIGDKLKLLEISQWGNLKLGNSGKYFFGTRNLNITATDIPNLSGTTNMNYAFASSGISTVPSMNDWDVSGVTDMSYMFANMDTTAETGRFNQSIDRWDVSNVTNMGAMFYWATSFNQPIGEWKGKTSQVTSMGSMFESATAFNQPLNEWDVSHVTNMMQMFFSATSFNQPLDRWDVSSVTNMGTMFASTPFNQPIGNWDVSRVMMMNQMFWHATAFNQPLNQWKVSNVTDMERMFGYTAFDQSIGNWDVSNVFVMNQMFANVTLSTENYDNLLIGWSKLQSPRPRYFDAGNSKYYPNNAAEARKKLIDDYNWTISDAGSEPCPSTDFGANWDSSKKELVIITHGWRGSACDDWVVNMRNNIANNSNPDTTVVGTFDWKAGAATDPIVGSIDAYNNAGRNRITGKRGHYIIKKGAGETLYNELIALQLTKDTNIHLIAHSAGANVIQTAVDLLAEHYKNDSSNAPSIHLTFLDAYVPFQSERDRFGDLHGLNGYAEQYVDNRVVDPSLPEAAEFADATHNKFKNAVNFDVTSLDSTALTHRSAGGHMWPVQFYDDSIANQKFTLPLSSDKDAIKFKMGFPFSVENTNSNKLDISTDLDLLNAHKEQWCVITNVSEPYRRCLWGENDQIRNKIVTDPAQAVTVTVPDEMNNYLVDVSQLVSDGSAVVPKITINSDNATVEIPDQTRVIGPAGWDGLITAPTKKSITSKGGHPNKYYNTFLVGIGDAKLSFEKAVKITLPNQANANKKVGFIKPGMEDFTEIAKPCDQNSQAWADAYLGSVSFKEEECRINAENNTDLVIWTKHFTTFATYTEEDATSEVTSSLTHDSGTKTIEYTFSESVSLVNEDLSAVNVSLADALAIYEASSYQNLPSDGSEPIRVVGVTITGAAFDSTGTKLTVTYSGNLVKQDDKDYVLGLWGRTIVDVANNKVALSASQMFTVPGTGTIVPTLTSFSADPTVVHTDSSEQQITASLKISGLNTGSCELYSVETDEYHTGQIMPVSGNDYTCEVVLPVGATQGRWNFSLILNSITGNANYYGVDGVSGNDISTSVLGAVGTFIMNGNTVVDGISVKSAPVKIEYTEGDHLDLLGLVVTLTKSDLSTQDVAFADFAANGITTDKSNGKELSAGDTKITVSANGHSVIQEISVLAADITPPVIKTDQIISFDALSEKTYSNADFNVTAMATSGLDVSFASQTPDVCTVTGNAVHIVAVGTCTITASQVGNDNFNVATDVSQSFVITKADANIEVFDFSGVYDGLAHNATGTASGIEATPVDLSSLLHFGDSFTDVPGGTAEWTFDGNENYNSASGSVNIKLSQAPSIVSVSCPDNATYIYTGHEQTPCTAYYSTNGDLPSVDGPLILTYENNVNAGMATASVTYQGDANHAGSSGSATFEISKALATITADNITKTYGDVNPQLTARVSGTVNNETLNYSLSTSATPLSKVGEDHPNLITPESNPNYDIIKIDGTVTIIKKALIAKVNDVNKVYGFVDPELTVSYYGFVTGDTAASFDSQIIIERVVGEDVGVYEIKAFGAKNNNYDISYINGIFTIKQNTPDQDGVAILLDKTNKVVLTDALQPVTIEIYDGVENPSIDVSALVDGQGVATLPEITVNAGVVNVLIPAGTIVKGPAGWDGVILAPTAETSTGGTPPAGFSVGDAVFSLGSLTGTLNFSKPVSITLSDVTGAVGYRPAGSDQWLRITNKCTGTFAEPTYELSSGECAISDGADTKILTFHFTSFGDLTDIQPPTVVSAQTQDANGNGKIDSIKLAFSEKIDDTKLATETADKWDVVNYEGESIGTGLVANDEILVLGIAEGLVSDLNDILTVTYTQVSGSQQSTHDLAGNELLSGSWSAANELVVDTTAPVIEAHDNVTIEATGTLTPATYTLPATADLVDGAGTAICAPLSGTTFPLGTTTITCSAIDAAGNHASETTFQIIVVDTTAPEPVKNLKAKYSSTDGGKVKLSWKAEDETIEKVNVYRGTTKHFTANQDSRISRQARGDENYSDKNVKSGRTYYYKVITEDAVGNRSVVKLVKITIPVKHTKDIVESASEDNKLTDDNKLEKRGDAESIAPTEDLIENKPNKGTVLGEAAEKKLRVELWDSNWKWILIVIAAAGIFIWRKANKKRRLNEESLV